MRMKGNIYPLLLIIGWLVLATLIIRALKLDSLAVFVVLAPVPIVIAFQCWKDDKK